MRRCRFAWIFAALVWIVAISSSGQTELHAQESPTVRTPPPQQIETSSLQPRPNADRYTLSHERYEKAVAYSRAGYTLYFLSVFVGFAMLLIVLWSGLAGRLRDYAQRKTENRFLQGLIFIPLLVLLLRLADLPVHAVWHGLSLHYEQSVQGWGSWLFDWGKVSAMVVVFYFIMGLLVFFAIRWSPRRWWFYFWLVALLLLLFVFFV